jgi:hypothetical protein
VTKTPVDKDSPEYNSSSRNATTKSDKIHFGRYFFSLSTTTKSKEKELPLMRMEWQTDTDNNNNNNKMCTR